MEITMARHRAEIKTINYRLKKKKNGTYVLQNEVYYYKCGTDYCFPHMPDGESKWVDLETIGEPNEKKK